jgi:lysophospholipid acyltransferase (LPLAT)-like uncharacterized protein
MQTMASTIITSEEKTEAVRPPGLTQGFSLWIISHIGYWAIRILGRTVRWEVEGWENYRKAELAGKRIIYTVWHGRIFPAIYFWRNRGIVVMTSQHKDGEYIARVIRRFGFGAARGSSSRGGKRALVEMIRELRGNKDVGFTIDGPRGPCYVAKPGAVWVAAKTGAAVFPFHISAEKKWVLHSWDHFLIPKPFTRARVLMAPPIYVKPGASEQEIEEAQRLLQRVLDEIRMRGDSHWDGGKTR